MSASADVYQVCPKVAIFYQGRVLIAKRQSETELNETYTLVGGKLEHTDKTILAGIRRELQEEIGNDCSIRLLKTFAVVVEYIKQDGSRMILPHFYGEFLRGTISLSKEYSDFQWVLIEALPQLPRTIRNLEAVCRELIRITAIAGADDYTTFQELSS